MVAVKNQLDYSSLRLGIIGGGPGGYEAAMVASSLGAEVTIVESQDVGGSAVLTDVVPSKTLIATADAMTAAADADALGIKFASAGGATGDTPGLDTTTPAPAMWADLAGVNQRLLKLAKDQSADIHATLVRKGVRIICGRGRLLPDHTIEATTDAGTELIDVDAVLLAVGASPRELPSATPDGERILNWKQVYNLDLLPEHLIVIGSGVTGAEFASAYVGLGAEVTLVSSRDRVLPGEDPDAAAVLEDVLQKRGLNLLPRSRAKAVARTENGVTVTLEDGSTVDGSHCLLAVGAVPNTQDLGLDDAGVAVSESGHVVVDGVSRTTAFNVYAAGDCTGVMPLASVAAMQGRIAVAHLLGDAVKPLRIKQVSSNIFTSPEIATVGVTEADVESGRYQADVFTLSLNSNARAKMMHVKDGFVKVFARQGSGTVIGGVVVGPRASELIYPLAIAVSQKLNVDDIASTFTVYPSLSGSIAEAARRLHVHQ
ncbi:NAD(P)H-quinone dehydrogenase [Tersicoccus mangrovi]|uniref:NAD(P)H-quinone dehydrogenase n=1 Tax=Tersicoccus mangrovi TaxID=3121635 RepID=UPI003A7F3A17